MDNTKDNLKPYLTTKDNPYNQFDQFDEWLMFDVTHGYNTMQLLARMATQSDMLSEEENQQELERAMREIVAYANPNGNFIIKYGKA